MNKRDISRVSGKQFCTVLVFSMNSNSSTKCIVSNVIYHRTRFRLNDKRSWVTFRFCYVISLKLQIGEEVWSGDETFPDNVLFLVTGYKFPFRDFILEKRKKMYDLFIIWEIYFVIYRERISGITWVKV